VGTFLFGGVTCNVIYCRNCTPQVGGVNVIADKGGNNVTAFRVGDGEEVARGKGELIQVIFKVDLPFSTKVANVLIGFDGAWLIIQVVRASSSSS